ncbi:MAG: PHP domain-containing protein, partial [Solobacterium sp.]|nr:PHP domain-containing protein [Solobacterium sp.]
NQNDVNDANDCIEGLLNHFYKFGYHNLKISCHNHIEEEPIIEEIDLPIPVKPKEEVKKNFHEKHYSNRYENVQLEDVKEPMRNVIVTGEVSTIDNRENKNTNSVIQILTIFDGTSAIAAKRFSNKNVSAEEIMKLKEGTRAHFYGSIGVDNYSKELTLTINKIEELEKEVIIDSAKEKRVELHMHTNMSEMDGICSGENVVEYVFHLGHDGIVITDHGVVQSFVKSYNTVKGLLKKNQDRHFKLGLGCEMNVVDDHLKIVYNETDDTLNDLTYICFDLETTGLSCKYDSIIEFGAVKIKNHSIIDRKQLFIKPPINIPPTIIQKTNITNEMVEDAQTFEEVADELVEFIGDAVLVAHNASFDYYFFNEELKRCGKKPIMNTVIDTLDLSRAILKERHMYRLGNIARNYRITYDEEIAHRADYDAEVLSSVFLCLLKDATDKGAKTIHDLQEKVQDYDAFKKIRRSHTTVLAKDQIGLKSLYELVSKSHTDTLSVTGKSSSKEGAEVPAEPRVLRSDLNRVRDHLFIGTSCQNNEVFELACNGDDERLEKAMSWYDYVEIQPLPVYSTYVVLGNVPNMERVKDVLRRIITTAKKLGKPVCVTSDAHYCTKEQKIFRDVYIMNQGVGGVYHPLYIRNDAIRQRTKNPDQHLYLTQEMLDQFKWLDDDDLIHEIVIENPKKIFDALDDVYPVPSGVFPPVIEGSDDKLREICNNRAKELYEFNGEVPKIVSDRLNKELDNIIKNGYGVHYYIAHLLVKKSNDDGYVVGSRGSVGSSFTATMSGITEVNPLQPHYLCPHCRYSEWIEDPEVKSGFDLPDKECPHCHEIMKGDGQSIPFQTFLGFDADKTPDIDLNFSNEYQA